MSCEELDRWLNVRVSNKTELSKKFQRRSLRSRSNNILIPRQLIVGLTIFYPSWHYHFASPPKATGFESSILKKLDAQIHTFAAGWHRDYYDYIKHATSEHVTNCIYVWLIDCEFVELGRKGVIYCLMASSSGPFDVHLARFGGLILKHPHPHPQPSSTSLPIR